MAQSDSPVVTEFTPTLDEPLSGKESLALVASQLEQFPDAIDLIVTEEPPSPVGRSWAFDWEAGEFRRPLGQLAPQETRGAETLKNWVVKCLMTSRGAHPIHPPGYGLVRMDDVVGGLVGSPPSDLESRIREALLFHPRITDVTDFAYELEPDEEFVAVSFTVQTDQGAALLVDSLPLTP